MLQKRAVCYRRGRYVTEEGGMLQKRAVCYRRGRYVTEEGGMLQKMEVCTVAGALHETEIDHVVYYGSFYYSIKHIY